MVPILGCTDLDTGMNTIVMHRKIGRLFHALAAEKSIAESSPRERCSQRDHPVTGDCGSLHPRGHPIIQSEKRGLKISTPA